MIYYDIVIYELVKLFRVVVYDNYDDVQHDNFIIFTKN
jgi:hypothetical protein